MGGAHPEHLAHVRDAGRVEAERLVERIRFLQAGRREWGAGRGAGWEMRGRGATAARAACRWGGGATEEIRRRAWEERTQNISLMSVTLEVSQLDVSALILLNVLKSPLMSVMPETSQSAMGPYVAVAVASSELYASAAALRSASLVNMPGGEGGAGGGDGGGGGEGDGGGGEGEGGGGSGEGGGDGGGGGGLGGEGTEGGKGVGALLGGNGGTGGGGDGGCGGRLGGDGGAGGEGGDGGGGIGGGGDGGGGDGGGPGHTGSSSFLPEKAKLRPVSMPHRTLNVSATEATLLKLKLTSLLLTDSYFGLDVLVVSSYPSGLSLLLPCRLEQNRRLQPPDFMVSPAGSDSTSVSLPAGHSSYAPVSTPLAPTLGTQLPVSLTSSVFGWMPNSLRSPSIFTHSWPNPLAPSAPESKSK